MAKRTYYAILGVPRGESPSGIRAAYRDLARRLHPDIAGEQSTRAFQEVTEAYEVLADPRLRREYNDKLSRAADRGAVVAVTPLDPRPEPLVRGPQSVLGSPEGIRPSFEAMYERLLRNFTGVGIPKSEHVEGLNLEVLLTSGEAVQGCVVPVGVPVFYRCPQCRGSGREWLFPCTYCREQGMIETEEVVRIRIPPLVPAGSVFEVPLQGLGIHNFRLRLHVFVDA